MAVLTPVYPPDHGGIERLTERLCRGFTGFTPSVITLDAASDTSGTDDGLPVTRVRNVPRGGRRSIMRFHRAATAQLLRDPPDVVLSMHVRTTAPARALQIVRGTPFVQYVHAKEIRESPQTSRFVLTRAQRVIGVSRYSRDLAIEAGAHAGSVAVVPNGVDAVDLTPRDGRSARPTLVSVSRLQDRYKGHDTMLEAMPRIREQVPDVHWVVIGDGTLRPELTARANALGLSEHVTFAGAVGDDERDALLDAADAFVLPTRVPPGDRAGEGFGIVFLEAAARGIPAVGGLVPGVVDAVEDGVSGHLVDPNDPGAVAMACLRLLRDPDHARRMGAVARERSLEFSWESVVARVEAVLTDSLQRPEPLWPSTNRKAFAREMLLGPDVAT